MTLEQKLIICEMRLRCHPYREISERIGYSRQSICNFLHTFCYNVEANNSGYKLPLEKKLEICKTYLETKSFLSTARANNVTEREVQSVLTMVAQKFPRGIISHGYPNITRWQYENQMTRQELSKATYVPFTKLRPILKENEFSPMLIKYAKEIKEYTKLSYFEIYEKQLASIGITKETIKSLAEEIVKKKGEENAIREA